MVGHVGEENSTGLVVDGNVEHVLVSVRDLLSSGSLLARTCVRANAGSSRRGLQDHPPDRTHREPIVECEHSLLHERHRQCSESSCHLRSQISCPACLVSDGRDPTPGGSFAQDSPGERPEHRRAVSSITASSRDARSMASIVRQVRVAHMVAGSHRSSASSESVWRWRSVAGWVGATRASARGVTTGDESPC
jgi:hypothetical protein